MSPAVQESKEFKHKIKELEKKIRDMTHTIEEWPREWQQNLLFHGVPVPDKESFYTKVWPPEVVILQGSPRPRWCLRLSGRRWESGGRSGGGQGQDQACYAGSSDRPDQTDPCGARDRRLASSQCQLPGHHHPSILLPWLLLL